jgi:hypothetical protein
MKRQENYWNKTSAFVVFFTTSIAKTSTTNFCELFRDNILREYKLHVLSMKHLMGAFLTSILPSQVTHVAGLISDRVGIRLL